MTGTAPCVQSQSKVLTPSRIGEFATPGVNDEDETYPFRADPKGKYYHFETYVGEGDTQWGVFWGYEERFTASSTLKSTGAISYGADNLSNEISVDDELVGGTRNTAWCEGVTGYGVGEWVNMSIRTKSDYEGKDNEIRFDELMIVNGYAKDAITWKNNSRVKILRLYVGGKHWCDLHLNDVIKPQIFELKEVGWIFPAKSGKRITLPEKEAFTNISSFQWEYDIPKTPIYQTDLKFEIIEVYPGEKYDDTCITGIAVDVYGGLY